MAGCAPIARIASADSKAIALTVVLLVQGYSAHAANREEAMNELQEQSSAVAEALDDRRVFVMPIPISNPTIGTGLGATAMYLFEAGENAPPSSVGVGGLYTNTDTWGAGVATETYFANDKYRLSGGFGYFDANVDFFGIGSGAGDRGESIGISQKGLFFVPKFLFEIASGLYIGPRFRYIEVETSLQNELDLPGLPDDLLPDRVDNTTSGIGAVIEYDNRDSRFYPYSGSHAELTANLVRDWLGSDDEYEQVDVAYDRFQKVGEKTVLAWRVTGCFRKGDTPYYDLCLLGSPDDGVRGYVGGRYRDETSFTTQVELRTRFSNRFGGVVFLGAGQVAPSFGDMDMDNFLPTAGLGLRWMASEKDRINLSVDYAIGDDSDAWYFRIGESF